MKVTRPLLSATAAAALLVGVTGCAAPADETQTTVTVIGFPGLFAAQFEELVIQPYEEANPGVTIEYEEQSTSAESIGRVAASASDQPYDIAIVDKSAQPAANEQGLFEKIDEADVPNIADLVEEAQNADGYGPSIYIDSLTLLYNTEAVTTAPTSWTALFDSAYRGQVALSIDNALGLSLMVGLAHESGEDYHESIDPLIAQLTQLSGGQAQTFAPSPDVYTAVASGSAQLGLGWYARAQNFAAENPTLGVAVPPNGGVALTPTINLVTDGPEAETATAFLNYAIGEEAQGALAREGFYGPVNAKVELTGEELARSAALEGGALDGGVVPDWSFIAEHTSDWIQRIKREVIAQ